ncbi:hypothetical protein [Rhodococcus koreensis]|uniref:hypothetical protein n=1 Tax=Rhodococcus koreensis TaxID=99653 RepID=UPI00366CDB17
MQTVDPAPDAEWAALVDAAHRNVSELEHFNHASGQRGSSWALPVADGAYRDIPVWSGKGLWLRQVRHAVTNTDTGRAAVKQRRIGVETMMAVAAAHARFADSTTGRDITASVAKIGRVAGVSESVVQRARRVLRDLGVGHEVVRGRLLQSREFMAAELHHGGHQRGAASVWALSSPRWVIEATPRPAAAQRRSPTRSAHRVQTHQQRRQRQQAAATKAAASNPQLSGRDTLSLGSNVLEKFSRKRELTKRAPHAGATTTNTNRPLHTQRAAAQLAHLAPALTPDGHIGQLVDVLVRTGIDTTRWTGRDIADALTRDTQSRGWTWPDAKSWNTGGYSVQNPVQYAHMRLSHIDFTAPSPSEQRARIDAQRRAEQAARATAVAAARSRAASAEHRSAMRANWRTLATATSSTRPGRVLE